MMSWLCASTTPVLSVYSGLTLSFIVVELYRLRTNDLYSVAICGQSENRLHSSLEIGARLCLEPWNHFHVVFPPESQYCRLEEFEVSCVLESNDGGEKYNLCQCMCLSTNTD